MRVSFQEFKEIFKLIFHKLSKTSACFIDCCWIKLQNFPQLLSLLLFFFFIGKSVSSCLHGLLLLMTLCCIDYDHKTNNAPFL